MKTFNKIGILLIALLLTSCNSGGSISTTNNDPSSTENVEPVISDLREQGILYDLDLSKTVNNISTTNFDGEVISIGINEQEYTQTGFTIEENKLKLSKVALKNLLGDLPYSEKIDIRINTSTNHSYIMSVSVATKVINKSYELLEIVGSSEVVDSYYVLGSDIDMEGTEPFRLISNNIHTPISSWDPLTHNFDIGFKGIFDGRGHTISNLTTINKYNNLSGIFGQIMEGAVVKNVAFTNLVSDEYSALVGESSTFLGTLENVAVVMNEESQNLRFLWNISDSAVLKNVVAVGFSDLAYEASENAHTENLLTMIKNAPTKYIKTEYTNFNTSEDMISYIKDNNIFSDNDYFNLIENQLCFGETFLL